MKWPALSGLILSCALLLGGCAKPDPQSRPLKVWTAFEGNELEQFKELCKQFPQPVEVLAVPFDQLKNKVMIATPAGQGPDLIVGPQDWLGVFSVAHLLEPLSEATLAELKSDTGPVALDGVTYDGKVYAAPMLLEALALLRNPVLAPRSPQTLDDLRAYALEIQRDKKVYGLYFDLRELYFSWPFFAAYGATVFQGHLEPGLTGAGGLQACTYLRSLRQDGLIPLGAKNDFAKSMFLEGKVAMTLNGPWFMNDVRRHKTPYVIEPVPPATHPASSFVGVTGLMLSARSERKPDALALMQQLNRAESQVTMSLASGRVPARRAAQLQAGRDPVVGRDIQAFTRIVDHGVAMPNHPAANAVWDPMKQSLELISKGEVEPAAELKRSDQQIREKIQRMME